MISGLYQFTREIISLIRFYFVDKNEREIVFYAEDKNSYSYFEGLIDYLTNSADKDIYYITSEANDPLFESGNRRLHVFYVKVLLALFIGLCDSKVIVMTMPDLNIFHIKRSKFPANHLYMFHNIGSSFPVIRHAALFHYDTVFCVGPHHVEEIRRQEKLYNIGNKQLVEFGYFRLEKIYEEYRKFVMDRGNSEKHKTRVLIGPSWGENSIFNVCGDELIQVLLDNGYEVIARPHPMTNIHEPHIMENINKRFHGCRDFSYEEDIAYLDSLFRSDVLVTDWSGFMYEFAFGTERPVLFIDLPQKIVNPRYKEVGIEPIEIRLRQEIGEIIHPDHLGDTGRKVERLVADREKYREKIRSSRAKHVYNFGGSSRVGAEYILAYCADTPEGTAQETQRL